ncbi:hypothetical protein APHAL10511_000848 [Amanita phalloides]|nr:hypothetical protein APHAL10511_000848 [Amanita phalloides]
MENHLSINKALFTYRVKKGKDKGKLRPLTKKAFIDWINNMLKGANQLTLQGHSIHIGAVLEYLLWGMSFKTVKAKGQWASNAFTVYLHSHAEIMAPYMQDNQELAQHLHMHVVTLPISTGPTST